MLENDLHLEFDDTFAVETFGDIPPKKDYYPKPGMCDVCLKLIGDCSELQFSEMPVHSKVGRSVYVVCTEFVHVNEEMRNVCK